MPENLIGLLCFLFALVVVIACVTVVGHGLWLLFASWFGSQPKTRERARDGRRFRSCVGCGSEYFAPDGHCDECGLDPQSDQARELKDLLAATRSVERLLDTGKLTRELSEQIHQSIEARRHELLPRKREPELTPLQQLEAWFGPRDGKALSVEDKKRAMATVRNLQPSELRDLSARALIGIVNLFASLGMLSRACQIYDVLFAIYPNASITALEAPAALDIAEKLQDLPRLEKWARILEAVPNLHGRFPELAEAIEQVRQPIPEVKPILVEPMPAPVELATEPVMAPAWKAPESWRQPPETVAPIEPPKPVAPRRSFAEWIGVFMEERNIMWGELIGGTLIVGCSIALVISLWQTLQEVIPIFPFIILAAVTSALFAAGLYTLHHWKLESTSRGLLVIGTLMVPLNFLVLAGLSKPGESGWMEYLSEAAALGVFCWLLYRASQVLIEAPLQVPMPSAAAFTGAMLVSVTAQLFAHRWLADHDWGVGFHYLLTLLPVLAVVGAMGWILLRMMCVEDWTIRAVRAMLFALASLTFACGVNLSFVLWSGAELHGMRAMLIDVSPALTLLGIPILAAGALLHQKLTHADREQFALWRTLGTGVGLLGLVVMFAGFAVSVDSLPHRTFSGAVNVVTLLALAWTLRLPFLHIPMQIYLAALAIFGLHSQLELAELMQQPIAAPRLCGLLVVQVLLAELLLRFDRRIDGRIYAIGGAASSVLAIGTMLPFALPHPGLMALVLSCTASVWLISNARWRAAEITYACSLALAGATFFAIRFYAANLPFAEQLLWSLLTFATSMLAVSVSLRRSTLDWLTNVFRIPLQFASLFATFCVAGLLIVEQSRGQSWTTSAIACGWLAALWCVIAVLEGWPLLFGAFQATLGFTWVFAIGARLTHVELGWDHFEPHSLHIYALGLASLSFGWELLRIALRNRPNAMALLTPEFVPMDRIASGALIVVQFGLTMLLSVGAFGRELDFTPHEWRAFPAEWHDHAFSIWVWLITFVLAGVLVAWLREFDLRLPAMGLTLLLLTVPLLVAGTWFDAQFASASAARWGLALCYGVVSLLLWNRHRLGEERASLVPVVAMRGLLIVGAIVPMLAITLFVAVERFRGHNLPGPHEGTIFFQMTRAVSLLVPIALLSAALAGHGFIERSTRYLFAAGVLINLGSVGGFFLVLQKLGIPRAQTWVTVDALLLSAGVAWGWSIVWAWITSLLEKDHERPLDDPILLKFNVAIGVIPFALVLAQAVMWIMFLNDDAGRIWTQEAGSPWGWVTFALSAGGAGFLSWNRRAVVPMHLLGAWSLLAVGLLACSVEFAAPGNSLVALMFGCSVYACAWIWFTMLFDPAQLPRWLNYSHHRVESAVYSSLAAGVAIVLACGNLFKETHAVWSANSSILAATAFALLAYQHKQEIWASLTTATLMLASTILVVHFAPEHPHLTLCIVLTALAVLGTSSLARLALHRLLNAEDRDIGDLHLLPLQIIFGTLLNLLLSSIVLLTFIWEPAHPNFELKLDVDGLHADSLLLLGAGWLALLTNSVAAVWYVSRTRPTWVVHTVTVCGLAVGLGLAFSADLLFEPAWLAHHVLTISWTLLALAILALSWISHALDDLDTMRQCFPEQAARFWVTLCGAFVVLFALQAIFDESERPYLWSIGNTLAVSILLGALAIWARSAFYTFASGLLANVIGLFIFSAWAAQRNQLLNDEWATMFVLVQILSFGAAALVWSLLEWRLLRNAIDLSKEMPLPFSQFAILAGVLLLAVGVIVANARLLLRDALHTNTPLACIALGTLAAASLLEIWRPRFLRFTRFQLYICGLMAIGITLHSVPLPVLHDWYRYAALMLAGYVLLIVVLARIVLANSTLQTLLGLGDEDEQFSIAIKPTQSHWFWPAQLLSIGVVAALSVWITNAFDSWQSRLSGALACSLVTIAAFLLVKVWHRVANNEATRMLPRYLALTLALLVSLEVGWALLDTGVNVLAMQRVALSFTTVVVALFVCRFALPRAFADEGWFEAGRVIGSILGVISLGLLLVLLGFEFMAYDAVAKRTPLLLELAIPSSLALLALTGLAMYSALTKNADPYGIEDQGRTTYVYLMEVLVLLLFVHGRLNVPNLFHPVFGQFWYLVVSVLAFVGIAVAEICKRKDLPILAGPIKRSAIALAFVPVIAFRFLPLAVWLDGLGESIPGIVPFLDYLDRMRRDPQTFQMEALCWLLLGIFLGTLARLHRSANFGLVAALAINFGVWVLLGHSEMPFLERPQLWLIPLGLIVLVAEYINRDRLGFYPSMSVRYVGLMCIYLSSTFEMFKEGLDNQLFAVALAIIAVAGMLLGILFRVRAFLLAGFTALLVVTFAQIWHAAVQPGRTWIWWVCGIVLGVLILVMFALFEKHRNDVVKLLDNMKRWQ
jgi:hypothetical protein